MLRPRNATLHRHNAHRLRVYFTLLGLLFVGFTGLLVYISLTAEGPGTMVLFGGITQLLYLTAFIVTNIVVYCLGFRFPAARKALAAALVMAVIVGAGYAVFAFMVQANYSKNHQPLSYDSAASLITSCQVATVSEASNGWPELHFKDGTKRVVAGAVYLPKLQELAGQTLCYLSRPSFT